MENTTTETKPGTEAGAPTGGAQPAAADTTGKPAGAATATTTEKPQTTGETQKPDSKEVARRAFQDRDTRREKKASEELAEARKELERLKAQVATKQPEPEPEPSLIDDPEKWAKNVEERATKNALETIERSQAKAKADTEYRQSAEKAAEFLLTRSHLKEDKALLETVAKVIEEKYADVGVTNPMAAARLAYIDACAEKGITPDMDGFKSAGFDATKGAASTGIKPSSAGASKRTFAKGEVKKYLSGFTPGTKEWRAANSEVEEAYREGRVQR